MANIAIMNVGWKCLCVSVCIELYKIHILLYIFIYFYILTSNELILWNRAFYYKFIVTHLIKNFRGFYETLKFITVIRRIFPQIQLNPIHPRTTFL